jgi:sulfoxide reductase heme-binding subunit YedZ
MTKPQIFIAKTMLWCVALVPFLRLFYLGVQDDLGANPVEFVEHSTGIWALVALLLTLTMTPIRLITGQVWQIQLRRMLGLFMFFYACLHIAAYVWLDFAFIWEDMIKDIAKHPRILVGFAAFIIAIPLAVTSNSFMIKRLKTNWKKLHQAIYPMAILVVLHFLLLVKKDLTEPIYYAVVLALLLGIRVYYVVNKPKATKTM